MTEFEKGVLAMFYHLANKLDDESLRAGHARIAQELIDRDGAEVIAMQGKGVAPEDIRRLTES